MVMATSTTCPLSTGNKYGRHARAVIAITKMHFSNAGAAWPFVSKNHVSKEG